MLLNYLQCLKCKNDHVDIGNNNYYCHVAGVASVSPPSNERDSSEDDVCSRSAAVAKRATAFSTELARSRKRKKSRKHNCSDTGSSGKTALTKCENGELDTSCVIAERPSVMSATSNVEKNCNCADVRVATSCDYLCELTVAREGHQQSTEDSDGGVRSSVNDGQPLREGHPEGVKLRQPKKRHILRGGSSLCCVKRTRKRFPNTNGPCESNVHPNSMFSNLDLTSSSRTKTVSIDVVKQRTHSKRLRDQSRIESPPTRFVDLNDSQMSSDVGPVGSSCHKATATMETRQARKWSRRQRRRLAIKVCTPGTL